MTIIIAEVGVNHNGDMAIAKKLINCASSAGANIVKFQTFTASNLALKDAPKAQYQISSDNSTSSHYELLKNLELSEKDHLHLIKHCQSVGMEFLSTAFDTDSVRFLHSLGQRLFKIPSGEITNVPLLREIASCANEVIISTGMCTLDEVSFALRIFLDQGLPLDRITVLHCTTEYPAPMVDVNLNAMHSIKEAFNVNIGYSDHTMGIEVPIAAVAMGANVIEKHITLDRSMLGPDHSASLECNEFKNMVLAIRNIELALGSYSKAPSESEIKNISIARKSIVAKVSIKKGDIFTDKNLTTKRPGDGLPAVMWDSILGTKAVRDFAEDEKIII